MVFHSPDRNPPHPGVVHPAARRHLSRVARADRFDPGAILVTLLVLLLSLASASAARSEDDGAVAAAAPIVASPTAHETAPVTAPADLRDLDAWIVYRSRAHIPMLSDQSRVFYRRGLLAWRSGQESEVVRLVRGVATLDLTSLRMELSPPGT
jgi:hypothetical protein